MSEYNDFPKDFVTRTLKNLDNYTGIFEVTNLINNCLGLIIIPRQKMNNQISDYIFDEVNSDYGITKKTFRMCQIGTTHYQMFCGTLEMD